MSDPSPSVLFSSSSPSKAVKTSKLILEELIASAKSNGLHPVAVFDVDETLLLNHQERESRVAVNPPMKDLHDWLRSRGVTIYVVTARRKTNWSRRFLDAQLEGLGYPAPEECYMVNRKYDANPSASLFKRDARRHISEKKGHKIVLNAGDQASDMMLVAPYSKANAKFMAKLSESEYHGIAHADGISALSLKLPSTYTVA